MNRASWGRLVAAFAISAIPVSTWAGHAWGPYHWARSSNPVAITLGDNVNATWDSHLSLASSDWNVSSVLDTTVVAGATSPRRCSPATGKTEICNAKYGFTGWLGIAQIWISGDHIVRGAAKMNDSYFNNPPYNTTEWRNLVMCQEIGHLFGLGHQDEDFGNPPLGTCMDYSSDPVPNQHPNAHDYEQLETIYAHLDAPALPAPSPAKGNAAPPAFDQLDLAGPGQWGTLVRSSKDGHIETYELDFGRGYRVVTHVIWAE